MKKRKQFLSLLLILSMLLSCFPGTAVAEEEVTTKQLFFISTQESISGTEIRWSQLNSAPETVYDEEISTREGKEYYSFTGHIGSIATVDGETYTGGEITGNPVVTLSYLEPIRFSWVRGGTDVITTCSDSWDIHYKVSFPANDTVYQLSATMTNTPEVSNSFLYDGTETDAPAAHVFAPVEDEYLTQRILNAAGKYEAEGITYDVYKFVPGSTGYFEVYGSCTTTDPSTEYVSVTVYRSDIDPSGSQVCQEITTTMGNMVNGTYEAALSAELSASVTYYVIAESAGVSLGQLYLLESGFGGEGSGGNEEDGELTDAELIQMITANQKQITLGEEYDCTENGYFYQTLKKDGETLSLTFTDCEFGGTVYMLTVYNHTANLGSMEDYNIETISLENRTVAAPADSLVYIYGKADAKEHYAKFILTEATGGEGGGEDPGDQETYEEGKLYAVYDWAVEGYNAETGILTLENHPYIMGEGCGPCDPSIITGERYVFMKYLADGTWKLVEDVTITPVDMTDDQLQVEKNTKDKPYTVYYVTLYRIGEYVAAAGEGEAALTLTMNSTYPFMSLYTSPALSDDAILGYEVKWYAEYGESKTFYLIMDGLCGNREDWTITVEGSADLTAEDIVFKTTTAAGDNTYYVYEVTLSKEMIDQEFHVEFSDIHEDGGNCRNGMGFHIEGPGPQPGYLYAVHEGDVEGYNAETGELFLSEWANIMGEGSEVCDPSIVTGSWYVFMEYLTDGTWKLVKDVTIGPVEGLTDNQLQVEKITDDSYTRYRMTPYQIGEYAAVSGEGENAMTLTMGSRFPYMSLYTEPNLSVDSIVGRRLPWAGDYGDAKTFYLIMDGLCGEPETWGIKVEGSAGLTAEDIAFKDTLETEERTYYAYAVRLTKDMIGQNFFVEFTDVHEDGGNCSKGCDFQIEGAGPEPGHLYAVYDWEVKGYDEETGELTLTGDAYIMGDGCRPCDPRIIDGEWYVFMEYLADGTWKLVEDVTISPVDMMDEKLSSEIITNRAYTMYSVTPYKIGEYVAIAGEGEDALTLTMTSRFPSMGFYLNQALNEDEILDHEIAWKSEYGEAKSVYLIMDGLCGEPEGWTMTIEGNAGLLPADVTYMNILMDGDTTYYVYQVNLKKSMVGCDFHIEFTDEAAHENGGNCSYGYGFRVEGNGPEPGYLYAVYDWAVEGYDAETGALTLEEDPYIMGEGCNRATPDIGHGDSYVFMEYMEEKNGSHWWKLVEDVTVNSVGIIDNGLQVEKITQWYDYPLYNITPYEEGDYWVQEIAENGETAADVLSMMMTSEFPHSAFYNEMVVSPQNIIPWNFTWTQTMTAKDVYLLTEGLCENPEDWTITVEGVEGLAAEDIEYKGIIYHGMKEYHAYRVPLDLSMLGYELKIELTDEEVHAMHGEDGSCSMNMNLSIAAELKIADSKLDLTRPLHELENELYRDYGMKDGASLTRYLYMVTYDYSMDEPVIMAVFPFTAAGNLNVRFLAEETEDGPVWVEKDHGLTITQNTAGDNEYKVALDLSKNAAFDESKYQGYSVMVGQSDNLWIEMDKPHCEWVFSDTADLDKLDLSLAANQKTAFDAIERHISIDGEKASTFDKYMYIAHFNTSGECDSTNLTKIEAVNVTEDTPWVLSHFAGYYDDESEIYNPAENLSITQTVGNLVTFSYTGTPDNDMVEDWDGDWAYYVAQKGDFGHSWDAYILLQFEGGETEFEPKTGVLYAVDAMGNVGFDSDTGEVFLSDDVLIMGEGAAPFEPQLKVENYYYFIEYLADGTWRVVKDITFVPDGLADGSISIREMDNGITTMYIVVPKYIKDFKVEGTGHGGMPVSMTMTSVYPYCALSTEPVMAEDSILECHATWKADYGESKTFYLLAEDLCADVKDLKLTVDGTAGLQTKDFAYMYPIEKDGRTYHVYSVLLNKDMIGEYFDVIITDETAHEDGEGCYIWTTLYIRGALMMSKSELDLSKTIAENEGFLHRALDLADGETAARYLYMTSWSEGDNGDIIESIYPVSPREDFQIRFQTGMYEGKYPTWLMKDGEFGEEEDWEAPGLTVSNVGGNLYSFTANFIDNPVIDEDNPYHGYDVHMRHRIYDYGDIRVNLDHSQQGGEGTEESLPDSYVLRWYNVNYTGSTEAEFEGISPHQVFSDSSCIQQVKFVITDSSMNRIGEEHFVSVKPENLKLMVYDKQQGKYIDVEDGKNPFTIEFPYVNVPNAEDIMQISYNSSFDFQGPSYKLVFTGADEYLDNEDGVPAVRDLLIWTENVRESVELDKIQNTEENKWEVNLETDTYEGLETKEDCDVKKIEVALPETLFGEEEEQITITEDTQMDIKTDLGTVTLDSSVLTQIADTIADAETVKEVILDVAKIASGDKAFDDIAGITDALETAEVVLDLNLYCGEEKISQFGEGSVTVTLQYEVKNAGKKPVVYYVDDNGQKHEVEFTYDESTFELRFITNHFSVFAVEEEGTGLLLGDVNLDGEVTASDLTMLARHVAKIETITNADSLANAEVTGNDELTAEDLTKLARYVAKIIDSLE